MPPSDERGSPPSTSRHDLGLLLLQKFVELALPVSAPADALQPWRAWLAEPAWPGNPPPCNFDGWPPADTELGWRTAMPWLMECVTADAERALGADAADRILLEAYESLMRERQGDARLARTVHLLPERLLQAGESALLAQIRALERARAAEADARTTLQAVLDAATTGIMVMDHAGRVTHANDEAASMFGYPIGGLIGCRIEDLAPARYREAHRIGMEQAARDGTAAAVRPVARRHSGLRRDGTEFPLELTMRTLPLPDGKLHFTASLRDLTESLALQARMALTDRMVSVGTLAAGAAHEINNPLAYLTMNAEFVRDVLRDAARGAPLPPLGELVDALDQALDGARRVQDIVRDLRTLARSAPAPESGIDVRKPLETALRVTGSELRHRARVVEHLQPCPPVRGDEARLCQVFSNLLLNAAQAIPLGSTATHTVEVSTEATADGRVGVTIRDTGGGVAPEIRARIFDPFFTTRPPGQGLGLGLTITHAILENLGGTVALAPHPDGGTVVTVTLAPATPLDEAGTPVPETARPPFAELLVVDPEPLVGSTLAGALGRHRITSVPSARQALARLSTGEPCDAILFDATSPLLDAPRFWEELGVVRPELRARLVFTAGAPPVGELRSFLERLPNPCLEKPLDLAVLRRALSRVGD